eukprot:CAMPEP_0115501258 /NCGR_PEP_ID=MMETSP0271-20121206/68299_1 /TAXON_ID=71861 /ORGANISM="Scrippsiella trochoidea, Strain CCMP3099" /LENGTH=432 /DNA_ID=CAMNT_0002930175 /DNA_START=47 /DNA_END=1345 /DNA_ORIENTATION=+
MAAPFAGSSVCLGLGPLILRSRPGISAYFESLRLQAPKTAIDRYLVSNKQLQANTLGLGFRLSKRFDDLESGEERCAAWGSVVSGADCGDGWLRVGSRYLPETLCGVRVLLRHDASNAAEDTSKQALATHPQRKMSRSTSCCSTQTGTSEDELARMSVDADEREHGCEPLLSLWAGSHSVGKPGKRCEDASFVNSFALGVADGVGGMAAYRHFGVDSAAYASELMELTEQALEVGADTAQDAVAVAELQVRAYGASTAAVLKLTGCCLDAAVLGDSGFMVLRKSGQRFRVVARSKEQQHHWNFPYQLARLPPALEAHVAPDCPRDSAADCACQEVAVCPRDLVLAFTDGFSDNLYDDEILDAVERAVAGEDPLNPEVLAQELVAAAYARSRSSSACVPFGDAARKHGRLRFGGKLDDITVVAAWVTETGTPA